MAAANTDKFKKVSRRWVGQIGSGGVADASTTTIPLASTTNLATDTAVGVVIDRVDANGVSTPSLEETVIGVVSGSNLVNCVRGSEGTAQAHNAGAVVEVLITSKGYNDIIDGILAEHSQLGAHTAASTTAAGTVEIAIASEINTGTDATRAVSPDALAGSNLGIRYVEVPVFGPTTNVSTGDGKAYFHIPPGLNGMNLVYAHGMVVTAGTTNSTTVQIHNLTQTADMLTALIEVETGETGSDTAAPGVTIDTANDDVATNDRIRIDVDSVSTTAPKGLVVTLGFQLP